MSKLINAIRAYQTGDRFAIQEALHVIPSLEVENAWRTGPIGKFYRIHVTLGAKVDVLDPETFTSDRGEGFMSEVVRSVRYQIAEEVFNEFRTPLLKLRTNALKRGDKESADIVADILDSMFKV